MWLGHCHIFSSTRHVSLTLKPAFLRRTQFKEVRIRFKEPTPMHVDGEPWEQLPGEILVRPRKAQAVMLARRARRHSSSLRPEAGIRRLSDPARRPSALTDGGG